MFSRRRMAAMAALVVVSGCNSEGAVGSAATGSMRARLVTDAADDVASVRVDVLRGGAVVDSAQVTQMVVLTPDLAGGQTDRRGGDAFFLLRPGAYTVQATPLRADGQPSGRCAAAQASVVVRSGDTTEVVLSMFCSDPGSGGLDVVVTTDHPPVITNLVFDPSKFVRTCDVTTVRVTAVDADNQALVFTWAVTQAAAGARYALVPSGASAQFVAETSGSYQVHVSVADPDGHTAGLTFPLHVAPGPVVQCLPDDVVVPGQTGPKVGQLPGNDFPAKGAGAVRPGLGESPKRGVADVVVPTHEQVRDRFGTLAKNLPELVAGNPSAAPKPPRQVSFGGSFQRARFTLTSAGVTLTRVASINEGSLVPATQLQGGLLMLVRFRQEAAFVTTAPDPTVAYGFPEVEDQEHSVFTGQSAVLGLSLPGGLLSASTAPLISLEFYRLAPTVPAGTPVSPGSLRTLLAGAQLVGVVSSADLVAFFGGVIR